MFCPHCGKELLANSKFCTACGTQVFNQSSNGYNNSNSNANRNVNSYVQKALDPNSWPIVAGVALTVTVVFYFFVCEMLWSIDKFGLGYLLDIKLYIDIIIGIIKEGWYYVPLIVLCFMKRKNELLILGIGLVIVKRVLVLARVFNSEYANTLNKLGQILQFISWLLLLIVVIIFVVNELSMCRKDIAQFYFVPAVFMALAIVLYLLFNNGIKYMFNDIVNLSYFAFMTTFLECIGWFAEVVGIYAIGKWVTNK